MNMDHKYLSNPNIVDTNRIRGLWELMAGQRRIYLVAALSIGVASTLRAGTYYLIRYFVDDVLADESQHNQLPYIAFAFLAFALLQGLFTYISGRLAARTAENIVRQLRNYIYDHIQRLTFAYHDKTPTGELIQRTTSDIDAIRRFFSDQAIGFGRIILLFLVNFTALLLLSWRLALASVIVVPFVVALSYYFFNKISKAYEEYQQQEAVLSTTLQENLTGVRVVKAFARQEYEMEKFDRENWEKFLRGKHLFLIHSIYWPISDILVGTQMIAGLGLGALMVIDGALSIGSYLAFTGLIVWIIWPLRGLGRLIVQMSSGLVSFGRVREVLRVEREPLDEGIGIAIGGLVGKLEFEKIGFRYGDQAQILHDINFSVRPGMTVALLGATGSGKTTLVNLLPRFYEYTEGSLRLDGVELRDYSREALRQNIGIVAQEPFLFSRTIRENIVYGVGRDVTNREVEEAAQAAAMHDVILTFPEGYNTMVGERGVTLSGGQKQRIAIARTLLKDPRILIFDDSTSSVDPETEALIREALQKLMRGRTTFIIAHRVQSVQGADMILVLDRGQIVQSGNHAELMNEENIYRRIYELQTQVELELEREISGV
ncbi:MAG: ABC transporter ATP-binding protein [Chloroflexi bacterium]|nr:ABC transporter ATP-binding protein [Chloroflexota bacterium]